MRMTSFANRRLFLIFDDDDVARDVVLDANTRIMDLEPAVEKKIHDRSWKIAGLDRGLVPFSTDQQLLWYCTLRRMKLRTGYYIYE
eukprot:scaffold7395_cov175-Amphora_coffeaeformis.AAC.14